MNSTRNGCFTSSEIYKLMTNGRGSNTLGAPCLDYVKEKNFERKLGRSIQDENMARALSWGKLVEKMAFENLGHDYKLCSDETICHPEINCWLGTPDAIRYGTSAAVVDIKSPITLKSFCTLVECNTVDDLRNNHKDGEKYFWQLVSNAVLTEQEFAELVVYMPYQDELELIREMARNIDELNTFKYMWINYAQDEELPYLIRGGAYDNINVLRFEVKETYKAQLTQRVEVCKLMLHNLIGIK